VAERQWLCAFQTTLLEVHHHHQPLWTRVWVSSQEIWRRGKDAPLADRDNGTRSLQADLSHVVKGMFFRFVLNAFYGSVLVEVDRLTFLVSFRHRIEAALQLFSVQEDVEQP